MLLTHILTDVINNRIIHGTLDERHSNLLLTASRKQNNLRAQHQNELITFDPSITNKNDITKCFRIFTDPNITPRWPAQHRVDPETALWHQTIKIYTDGACDNNGKVDAKCGSGIWIAENEPRNQAIKVPGSAQSNQIGELVTSGYPKSNPIRVKNFS